MNRIVILLLTTLSIFGLLSACSSPKPEIPVESEESDSLFKPPGLAVLAGKEKILAVPGAYEWSIALADGTVQTTQTDADPPPLAVKEDEAKKVTPDTAIQLVFEIPPDRYTIRIWDEDKAISSSTQFDLSKQRGRVIYEVVATWPEGNASYAFPLFIED